MQSTPALFSSAACGAAYSFCSYRCASTLYFHSFAARLLAVPFCQPCLVQVASKNSKQDLKRRCWHRWSIRLWQWGRGRLAWLPETEETTLGLRDWLAGSLPNSSYSLMILCHLFFTTENTLRVLLSPGPLLYASWPKDPRAFGLPGLNLGMLRASWQGWLCSQQSWHEGERKEKGKGWWLCYLPQ